MKFTRMEEVAVLIVVSLAGKTTPVTLAEISATHGISVPFLKKITRLLKYSKLVEAKEGSGGGYFLARAPSDICLADIIRAVSGSGVEPFLSPDANSCPFGKRCMPLEIRRSLASALSNALTTVTIASLMENKRL